MNNNCKKLFSFLIFTLILDALTFDAKGWEYVWDFSVDNICYDFVSKEDFTVAAVALNTDTDEVIIPEKVEYESNIYTVNRINRLRLSDGGVNVFRALKMTPKYLTIPKSVKVIETGSFSGWAMDELIIEDGALEEIQERAFKNSRIRRLHLPDNLKRVREDAFANLSNLPYINIPDSIEEIGSMAFYGINPKSYHETDMEDYRNSNFNVATKEINKVGVFPKKLILPNSLKKIDSHAFNDSYWDDELVLPIYLTSINNSAFSFRSLKELIIPNMVENIEDYSFYTKVSSEDKGNMSYYYYYPDNLQTLTLGKSVQTVAKEAFGKAPLLKRFYCLPSTPPPFVFSKFNPDATVLVPPGRIDAYRNAKGWNHFSNFQELPNVLIQFQIHSYSIATNESAELRYIISNLSDVEIASQKWTVTRPGGSNVSGALTMEGDLVKGLQSGDYYLTLTLTDTQGEEYSERCVVLVDSDGSGIGQIISEADYTIDSKPRIFNLQGVYLGQNTKDLPSGIYLYYSHGKTQKIHIK